MFVTASMPDWIRVGQMVTTLLISDPVGLVGTMYKGAIDQSKTPTQYAMGFIFLFLIGGRTGIPNAIASLDLHLSDTDFIVGHFHYVMAVAGTFAIFAGVYYIFPKMTGRMYDEDVGKVGFWLSFFGTNVAF